MKKNCIINTCSNDAADGFDFPIDVNLRKEWLTVINESNRRRNSRSAKICRHHFKKDDIIEDVKSGM